MSGRQCHPLTALPQELIEKFHTEAQARFTNAKVRDGITELSLPKIQTDMLKDFDKWVWILNSVNLV